MKLIYSTLIILIVIIISITIIIIISVITSIIAIIINSTKDDIWDLDELFHKLTNFLDAWCPVSKKSRRYFHFLLSLAYPIDRLDWALLSVVVLFHHLFPLLEKVEIRAFILPRNFPAVLIIFTGQGGAGNPPPSPRAGFPVGRGVHPCTGAS